MGHPMGTLGLKNICLPHFSGKSEDWAAFARDWKRYLALQHENSGSPDVPLPNFLTLETCKECLDEGSRGRYELEYQKNPELRFYDFFNILDKLHGKDMQGQHRQNWLKVRLTHNGQNHPF